MSPIAPQPNPQEQPQHVVINLDRELVSQALVEALNLLESLQAQRSADHLCSTICSQVQLRISYAVLHADIPEFKRSEMQLLALHHNRLATSLWNAQRRLHQKHLANPA